MPPLTKSQYDISHKNDGHIAQKLKVTAFNQCAFFFPQAYKYSSWRTVCGVFFARTVMTISPARKKAQQIVRQLRELCEITDYNFYSSAVSSGFL